MRGPWHLPKVPPLNPPLHMTLLLFIKQAAIQLNLLRPTIQLLAVDMLHWMVLI